MQKSIFREYDIRGKVGDEFQLSQVSKLGRAIATYFKSATAVKTVAIGRDLRDHSLGIQIDLVQALKSSGLNVVELGLCHTPALYFAMHNLSVDAGIMVTASHNGLEYNGLKICLGTEPLWGPAIQEIYALYTAYEPLVRHHTLPGSVTRHAIVHDYVLWMVAHFKHLKGMDLSLVIDCGRGATSVVMPQLIKFLHWNNVTLLCIDGDDSDVVHEANPVIVQNMEHVRTVLIHSDAQCGIGFDGDGDRMAPMTKLGRLIAGDELLAVFAHDLKEQYPGAAVVFDSKASNSLIELLTQWDLHPHMVATGHPHIKIGMRKHEAILGGELSCHFIFKDRYFGYDDGIYAALRLIEIMVNTGKTLQELTAIFPRKFTSPELRISCPDDCKNNIVDMIRKQLSQDSSVTLLTIDGVRATMADGWGIIRVSHTQPVLSMRFESDTAAGFLRLRDFFANLLCPYIDVKDLLALDKESAE